jgi:hypothetical protein
LANFAFTDAKLLINAVDMSTMAKKVTLKTSAAELTNTPFGSTYNTRLGGLKDYTLDVEWNQDFAAAQVDALLFPLLGTVTTFEVRPTSAARSTTNPGYTGSVLIKDYAVVDGKVGDIAQMATSWPCAAPLVRNVV